MGTQLVGIIITTSCTKEVINLRKETKKKKKNSNRKPFNCYHLLRKLSIEYIGNIVFYFSQKTGFDISCFVSIWDKLHEMSILKCH